MAGAGTTDIRRIAVLHLHRGPMDFDVTVSGEDFDLGADAPRFLKPIRITGNVSIVDDQVIASVKLRGEGTAPCARCLEDAKQEFNQDFFLAFELPKERFIDLLPLLREEMLLEQPLQVLCRPKCKGLCAECGTNLNTGSCKCAKRS